MKKQVSKGFNIEEITELLNLFNKLPVREQDRFWGMLKGAAIVCGAEVSA